VNLITKASVDINQPISVVFDYVSNMERFENWFPEVISIKSANDMMHGDIGKEYFEKVNIPVRGEKRIKITVKEVEDNKRFVTEGSFPPLLPRMEISLTENNLESCTLNYRMYSRNNNPLVRIFLLPIAKIVMSKRATKGVSNLKYKLET